MDTIELVKAWGGWDSDVGGSGEEKRNIWNTFNNIFFNPVTLLSITFIKHRKLYLELDNADKPLTNSLIRKSLWALYTTRLLC